MHGEILTTVIHEKYGRVIRAHRHAVAREERLREGWLREMGEMGEARGADGV